MKTFFQSPTWQKLKWPLIALALVLLFNAFFTAGFFNLEIKNGRLYGSIIDIFNRAAPVMLLSLGMTLVIATGGVDLSVGAVMAIAGSIAALLLTKTQLPVPLVVLICLAACATTGIWNGALVGFFSVPPIVATLILMVSGRGIAQLLTDGQILTFENKTFEFIGRGHLGSVIEFKVSGLMLVLVFALATWLTVRAETKLSLRWAIPLRVLAFTMLIPIIALGLLFSFKMICLCPFPVVLVAIAFICIELSARRTAAGLFIESTGDNETASRYAGVNTRLVKVLVYAVCSLIAGLAGLIAVADIKAADTNNAGLWLELDAILATVIGGTSLLGGRFYLIGSLVGAILIQTLTTTILTRGVPVEWTLVVKAIVIIAVCLLQSEQFRKTVFARRSRSTV